LHRNIWGSSVAFFITKLDKANPQAISNTLWAVANLGYKLTEQPLLQMLSALVNQLPHVLPQDISMSLVAVVTFGQPVPHNLLQQLLEAFVAQLAQATPQAVANTCGPVPRSSCCPWT